MSKITITTMEGIATLDLDTSLVNVAYEKKTTHITTHHLTEQTTLYFQLPKTPHNIKNSILSKLKEKNYPSLIVS